MSKHTKKVNQESIVQNVSETTTKGIVAGIKSISSFISNISISLTLDKRVHKTYEDVKTFDVSRKEYRLNIMITK